MSAPHALVVANLRLVERIARKLGLTPRSRSWLDCVGAGNVALVEAAQDFEQGAGAQFQTYAWFRIRGAIQDQLYSEHPVRVTRHGRDLGDAVMHVEFTGTEGAPADVESALAEEIDCNRGRARLARARRHKLI